MPWRVNWAPPVSRFFARDLTGRLRPSYFPFVEPGVEIVTPNAEDLDSVQLIRHDLPFAFDTDPVAARHVPSGRSPR